MVVHHPPYCVRTSQNNKRKLHQKCDQKGGDVASAHSQGEKMTRRESSCQSHFTSNQLRMYLHSRSTPTSLQQPLFHWKKRQHESKTFLSHGGGGIAMVQWLSAVASVSSSDQVEPILGHSVVVIVIIIIIDSIHHTGSNGGSSTKSGSYEKVSRT
jgi:hypothetical protein